MYAILIKDKTNYRFYTVERAITKEESHEETDPDTHEVKTVTTTVETGETEIVKYTTDSKDELEATCIALLDKYTAKDFIPVDLLGYKTDLIWDKVTNSEE